MNIYKELVNKQKHLAVIGLGYVGMPIAVQFAKQIKVIGFDLNSKKIVSGMDKESCDEIAKVYELVVEVGVAHESFKNLDHLSLLNNVSNDKKVLIDVKSVLDKEKYLKLGINLWRF